jgi:CheY-like chemotaxis protein
MSKKLLLADDSITIQKVIGITFANEDFSLTITDNGEDAIAKANEILPDIILADVVMPGKNGYEVCQEVKSNSATSHIPVLLLAGTFEAFDEDLATKVGADDYISKPFESQELINKVKDLLARGAKAIPTALAEPAMPEAAPAPVAEPEAPSPISLDDLSAGTPDLEEISPELLEPEPLEPEPIGAESLEPEPMMEEASPFDAAAPAPPSPTELDTPAASTDQGGEDMWSVDEFNRYMDDSPSPPAPQVGPAPEAAVMDVPASPEPIQDDLGTVDSGDFGEPDMMLGAEVTEIGAESLEPEPLAIEPEALEPEPMDMEPEALEPEPMELEPEALEPEPMEMEPEALEPEPMEMEPEALEPEPMEMEPEALDPEPMELEPEALEPDPMEETSPVAASPEPVEFSSYEQQFSSDDFSAGESAPAEATAPGASEAAAPVGGDAQSMEKVAWEVVPEMAEKIIREVVEKKIEEVLWEILPDLAEEMIKEQIKKLTEGV